MSSAYFFYRNFNIRQVLNVLCYTTETPHMLTSTQKLTRLYRYYEFNFQMSAATWERTDYQWKPMRPRRLPSKYSNVQAKARTTLRRTWELCSVCTNPGALWTTYQRQIGSKHDNQRFKTVFRNKWSILCMVWLLANRWSFRLLYRQNDRSSQTRLRLSLLSQLPLWKPCLAYGPPCSVWRRCRLRILQKMIRLHSINIPFYHTPGHLIQIYFYTSF